MVVVIAFDNSLCLSPHEEWATLVWKQAGSKSGSLSAIYSVPMIWSACCVCAGAGFSCPTQGVKWVTNVQPGDCRNCILRAKVCSTTLSACCSWEQCAALRCNKAGILTPGLWSTLRSLLCSINSPVSNMSLKRSESAKPFLQHTSV